MKKPVIPGGSRFAHALRRASSHAAPGIDRAKPFDIWELFVTFTG